MSLGTLLVVEDDEAIRRGLVDAVKFAGYRVLEADNGRDGLDLAVAADDIIIRQVGAARGSVAAAGATQWLPIIVGDRRAREILLLCEEIPAAKAL